MAERSSNEQPPFHARHEQRRPPYADDGPAPSPATPPEAGKGPASPDRTLRVHLSAANGGRRFMECVALIAHDVAHAVVVVAALFVFLLLALPYLVFRLRASTPSSGAGDGRSTPPNEATHDR